jgi:hypothetical protein
MRYKHTLIFFALLSTFWAQTSRAEQTRDWMVGPQPGGTVLNLDIVFPGAQAQVEHRIPIYGIANELWLKANTLLVTPFFETQADVDLRLVILSIGGSVGYRNNFRAIEFGAREPLDRQHRRSRELSGNTTNVSNVFGEGRATLALPFNDHAVFLSVNGLRFEGGPDRIFDWRTAVVRDSGSYVNSNNTLFLKQRSLGSIGPQLQILNYELDGKRHTQFNYGFTLVTRPGFMRKNDIFFLSMLFNFNDSGKQSQSDTYGAHLFFAPMAFQLAYRMIFELTEQKSPGDDPEEAVE